jgi:cell division protein FtsI/penicillin-binding protein 2
MDGVLVRDWESSDRKKKTAQVVVSQSKVDEVLTGLHKGTSGGYLRANKTMDRIRSY